MTKFASHKGTGRERGESLFPMPTLLRVLFWGFIIAGIVYGSMNALAIMVKPKQGEITVRVPPEKLQRRP